MRTPAQTTPIALADLGLHFDSGTRTYHDDRRRDADVLYWHGVPVPMPARRAGDR